VTNYRVQVMLEFRDEFIIEASSEDEAQRLAVEQAENFTVFNAVENTHFEFDDIYSFDPEEVA
jgi:transcriptional antiterminator Rof (Rho-off)